jgi:hypothetical protein
MRQLFSGGNPWIKPSQLHSVHSADSNEISILFNVQFLFHLKTILSSQINLSLDITAKVLIDFILKSHKLRRFATNEDSIIRDIEDETEAEAEAEREEEE